MMKNTDIRDNLLVTAGSRAAYLDSFNVIELPPGVDGEDEIAEFVVSMVNEYIEQDIDESFDIFIERSLVKRFGKE